MRFKMIGYGKTQRPAGSGKLLDWPVVGVALQKNYISVYLSVTAEEEAIGKRLERVLPLSIFA